MTDASEPRAQGTPAAEEIWTIRRVIAWTASHFEKKDIDSPRLTAEILLAHVLSTTRVRLYIDLDRPLEARELKAFRGLISRRIEGEPTQYLTGVKEFYNRAFSVDARVLVPRPETELLVDTILRELPKDAPVHVLDLCTGSGCIAASLAAERPLAQVTAVDLSPGACDVAKQNCETLKVAARVQVLEGDLFAPLPREARFELVVSNPPYIRSEEIPALSREVQREPKLALDGGPDGLVLLRRIVSGARAWLKPGGWLALEIAETQGGAVQQLLTDAGYDEVRIDKDLERRDRHAYGRQPAAAAPQ
jgi:release factor glutamine methyltransferase